jgi:hypothetical protein
MRKYFTSVILVFWLVTLGCGPGGSDGLVETRRDEGKLKLLGIEYGKFVALNNNVPPRDQEVFVKYLRRRQSRLAGYGLKSMDELLVSPREGQKMIVVQDGKKGIMSPDGFPWAAFEETGVGGTRIVVSGRGTIVEMSEDEFERTFK